MPRAVGPERRSRRHKKKKKRRHYHARHSRSSSTSDADSSSTSEVHHQGGEIVYGRMRSDEATSSNRRHDSSSTRSTSDFDPPSSHRSQTTTSRRLPLPVADDIDLSEEMHEIAYYISDRPEMARQMFNVLHVARLDALVPPELKGLSEAELIEMCTIELEGMSRQRIRATLSGQPLLDSSDSEESDDENTDEMDREDVEIRLMAADSTTRAGESGPESVGRPPSVPINGLKTEDDPNVVYGSSDDDEDEFTDEEQLPPDQLRIADTVSSVPVESPKKKQRDEFDLSSDDDIPWTEEIEEKQEIRNVSLGEEQNVQKAVSMKPKKRPRLELEEGEVNSEVEDEAEPADGEDLREIADETDDGSKPQEILVATAVEHPIVFSEEAPKNDESDPMPSADQSFTTVAAIECERVLWSDWVATVQERGDPEMLGLGKLDNWISGDRGGPSNVALPARQEDNGEEEANVDEPTSERSSNGSGFWASDNEQKAADDNESEKSDQEVLSTVPNKPVRETNLYRDADLSSVEIEQIGTRREVIEDADKVTDEDTATAVTQTIEDADDEDVSSCSDESDDSDGDYADNGDVDDLGFEVQDENFLGLTIMEDALVAAKLKIANAFSGLALPESDAESDDSSTSAPEIPGVNDDRVTLLDQLRKKRAQEIAHVEVPSTKKPEDNTTAARRHRSVVTIRCLYKQIRRQRELAAQRQQQLIYTAEEEARCKLVREAFLQAKRERRRQKRAEAIAAGKRYLPSHRRKQMKAKVRPMEPAQPPWPEAPVINRRPPRVKKPPKPKENKTTKELKSQVREIHEQHTAEMTRKANLLDKLRREREQLLLRADDDVPSSSGKSEMKLTEKEKKTRLLSSNSSSRVAKKLEDTGERCHNRPGPIANPAQEQSMQPSLIERENKRKSTELAEENERKRRKRQEEAEAHLELRRKAVLAEEQKKSAEEEAKRLAMLELEMRARAIRALMKRD